MSLPDPIETAVTAAAIGVLRRHAQRLRQRASGLTSTTLDSGGRLVVIAEPEARTMLGTAEFFESVAADLRGDCP